MQPIGNKHLIEVDGATVAYDGTPALEDAGLLVAGGDYIAVVGPSGSGKTTLLKVLAGAITPWPGRAVRSADLRIGYVPQVETVNWFFPVTVMEAVLMAGGRRLVPWPSAREVARAETVLRRIGLADLKDRHIRALSGGQQQRTFIARALMGEPNVLLLDEPISGVDVAARHEVLHLLHELNHDDGVAIVITTHDLNGIAAHMHQLVCLNRRIVAAGTPAEVLTPEVLEKTYGAPMDVLSHGGMPVVVDHLEAAATEQPHLAAEIHHDRAEAHHDHPSNP